MFDNVAAHSFIGEPITGDHPSLAVTRDNWRDRARGTIMGAMREGDYLWTVDQIAASSACRHVDLSTN